MCILVKSDIVINNAFLARKNRANSVLRFSELQEFCNIIYDEITNAATYGNQYKYVFFEVDEDDVKHFCSNDKNFIMGIDKVVALGDIKDADVEKINSVYGYTIRHSLENARNRFAQMNRI